MENEKDNEILDSKEPVEVDVPKRKSPINIVLIGLIVIMLALLGWQMLNMNNTPDNYDDLLAGEDPTVEVTQPEAVKLGTELFDRDIIKLDFSDVTLKLENEDILTYYAELTSDISNFTPVYDKSFIPSDNIFKMRFEDEESDEGKTRTSTSIYFFNEVVGEQSYCTVVHGGVIVGNYLIPSAYYGNLFNIVYASEKVTEYTKEVLKADIASLIEHEKEVSIHLDESHNVLDNGIQLETFETLVKNKENATMMYALSDDTYVIVCYMNFKYYVFVTNTDGEVLQQGDYKHYTMWKDNYLYCYNTSVLETSENFMLDGDGMSLKVVK